MSKEKKEIIIHEIDDEYAVLIVTNDDDFEYEDEGELTLSDAEALAEEIKKKYPDYSIVHSLIG